MNVAILTNFQDLNPGYSLSGIVRDQVTMLTKYGHTVHVFVSEQFNNKYPGIPEAIIHHVVPFGHLKDYHTINDLTKDHEALAVKVAIMLIKYFNELNIEVVFTHDWIFTGWNLPYALGVLEASPQYQCRWLHWVHSVPNTFYDWWQIKRYGANHKIVFPNRTDRIRVAEQYRGEVTDVRVIPHIKDLRTWYDFAPETVDFIDVVPNIMQADFVQIYPASMDRLDAKGLHIVIKIFSHLKALGFSVCLVIANQWASNRDDDAGKASRAILEKQLMVASNLGLEAGSEILFTSTIKDEYETGISHRMLRELNLCGNLFIFPTHEESFGLVGPEAALGGAFMVLNQSLQMMREVYNDEGLYFDFGSFTFTPQYRDPDQIYKHIAVTIEGLCYRNELFLTRTICRKKFNYDVLYRRKYLPYMTED